MTNTASNLPTVEGIDGLLDQTDLLDDADERRRLRLGLLAAFLTDEAPDVGVHATESMTPAEPLEQLAGLLAGLGGSKPAASASVAA